MIATPFPSRSRNVGRYGDVYGEAVVGTYPEGRDLGTAKTNLLLDRGNEVNVRIGLAQLPRRLDEGVNRYPVVEGYADKPVLAEALQAAVPGDDGAYPDAHLLGFLPALGTDVNEDLIPGRGLVPLLRLLDVRRN